MSVTITVCISIALMLYCGSYHSDFDSKTVVLVCSELFVGGIIFLLVFLDEHDLIPLFDAVRLKS